MYESVQLYLIPPQVQSYGFLNTCTRTEVEQVLESLYSLIRTVVIVAMAAVQRGLRLASLSGLQLLQKPRVVTTLYTNSCAHAAGSSTNGIPNQQQNSLWLWKCGFGLQQVRKWVSYFSFGKSSFI